MRQLPKALNIVACAIALYFALVWGADAVRILASPIHGFEDTAFVRSVYGLGHLLGLGPVGLVNTAAFFAALKLAAAGVFVLVVAERLRSLRDGKPDHETLQAALLLLLFSAELVAVSSVLGGATRVISLTSLQFFLAGAITIIGLFERSGRRVLRTRVERLEAERGYAVRTA